MIYAINYADINYKKAQKLNSWCFYHIGKVDKVFEYGVDDIDSKFFEEHEEILKAKRGGGYWLWKPYMIYNTLKKINDGDYLLYLDSGAIIVKNCAELVTIMEKLNQDILCFSTPFLEENFCKPSVLSAYKSEYASSFQIEATYIFMKKTKQVLHFIEDWLDVCCKKENIMDDDKYESPCIDHRHDQALFSLTCKSYGFQPYIGLSDRYLLKRMRDNYVDLYKPDSVDSRIKMYLNSFPKQKILLFFIVHHLGNANFFHLRVLKRVVKSVVYYLLNGRLFNKYTL